MATDDIDTFRREAADRLQENLTKIEALSQRLINAMSDRNPANPTLQGPAPDVFTKAATAYWAEIIQNPSRIFEHQVEYWSKSVSHFIEAQQALASGQITAPNDKTGDDPRFKNPLWKTHPYFNYVKQQYLINTAAILQAVEDIDGLGITEKRRVRHFARQISDMMSPTNFLPTNPDALERAIETDGASLVKGLENLVADIEANSGEMLVRLADENAFKLGENIATTEGQVIFRNDMMELIQFAPTTEKVHAIPVVIFPPWINKYYIMDLKEKNSLIKWIVDQGYTLFVVSWVNPNRDHADVGMEDYIEQGYLKAIEAVKEITDQKQVNAVGYCIAGTTLALTLSLLKRRKDKSIKSATFFTALTDFSDQGEFTPFLQNDFIDGIEQEVAQQGILRSFIMARTFSFLRANDLIYGPAIRHYMMGETPPAFDLLYWNGDGANLPGKMVMQYLRGLCQRNELADGGFDLMGEHLVLDDVDVPVCSVACETDHIAQAKDCYRGFQKFGSKDRTYILSESGHIAGIINPPSKRKYGHYTNEDLSGSFADWQEGAEFHHGSWWSRWGEWLKLKSGEQVPAREPGDSSYESICPAPGTYVSVKASL